MRKTKKQKELSVRVAKDVIRQLNAKKFEATRGVYVYMDKSAPEGETVDLQKFLKSAKPNCDVCGIGSLFISLVRLDNKFSFTPNEYIRYAPRHVAMRARLEKVFPAEELNQIECAFEEWRDSDGHEYQSDIDPDEALRKIAKNIIRNKGQFDPSEFIVKDSWIS